MGQSFLQVNSGNTLIGSTVYPAGSLVEVDSTVRDDLAFSIGGS